MEFTMYLKIVLLPILIWMTEAANIKQLIYERENLVQITDIMETMNLKVRDLLTDNGPFTMFVPYDLAFGVDRMPTFQRSILFSQGSPSTKEQVNNQIRYHIVNGRLRANDLQDEARKTKALNAPFLFIRRIDGDKLYVNGARLVEVDIEADNGIIHIINTFLGQPLEPGDGVPLSLSARGYIEDVGAQQTDQKLKSSKFLELLEAYDAEFRNQANNVLNNLEMTLFLPTDESLRSFVSSDLANIMRDRLVLQRLVERHIIHTCSNPDSGECDKDNVYATGILQDMAVDDENVEIEAMFGSITPTIFNSELYVSNNCGGNKIVWGNITVQNGVIHMIDGFLGYRERNALGYLRNNEDLDTFYDLADGAPDYIKSWLQKGSGAETVPLDERVTILAPIETAMKDYSLSSGDLRDLHVRYHVLQGEMPVEQMVNNTVRSMFPSDSALKPNFKAVFTQYENGDTYVTVDHVRARIIRPNICVKNGLIHIVDNILGVPLYTIWDFIYREGPLSYLYRQLEYTGYEQELDEELKEYTFFAPVDEAFELMRKTEVGRKYLDPLRIADRGPTVLYGRHLVQGSLYIDELTRESTEVTTYATKTLGKPGNNFKIICNRDPCYIEFEGEKITFNQTDIKMTNGVVHLINEVIYTDNEAREAQLISGAAIHNISIIPFIVFFYVMVLL